MKGGKGKEKEERKENEGKKRRKESFGDFLGLDGRKSLIPKLKFFVLTRAMRGHQKGGISPNIHRRGFGEIKGFEFRKCFKASYGFYYAPRGRDCKTQEKFNFYEKGQNCNLLL